MDSLEDRFAIPVLWKKRPELCLTIPSSVKGLGVFFAVSFSLVFGQKTQQVFRLAKYRQVALIESFGVRWESAASGWLRPWCHDWPITSNETGRTDLMADLYCTWLRAVVALVFFYVGSI